MSTVARVSPVAEVSLVIVRELRRNLRSTKGLLLASLSLLGGFSVALLLIKLSELKRERVGDFSPEQLRGLRETLLSETYGDAELGRFLSGSPDALLGVLQLTIWLTPLLVTLMGFDGISGELQHKTVRYWTLRTRRGSYFVGKWLGLFATVSLVTLAMDALIWGVCVARGEASLADTLVWGVRFWIVSLPMSLVWCAVATLVSSLFRVPFQALLVTSTAFTGLWVLWVIGFVSPSLYFLKYAYPNHVHALLLSPAGSQVASGLAACLGIAALYVGLGASSFHRRDV